MELVNKIGYAYDGLEDAFPPCEPGVEPFGSRVLVQVRTPKRKTAGGIILNEDIRETEIYNTQVAKVLAVGPLAFRNRNTMEQWPEGSWCKAGDFVRIPKWAGDRWTHKPVDPNGEDIYLIIFNDLDIIGKIVGDPLTIRAFL